MSVQYSSNIIKINPATGLANELGRTKVCYDAHATTRRDEEDGRRRTTKTRTLRSHRNNVEAGKVTRHLFDKQAKAGNLPVIDMVFKDHNLGWVESMGEKPSMDLMVFEEDIPAPIYVDCSGAAQAAAEWNAKHGVWDEAYEAGLAEMAELDRQEAEQLWSWVCTPDNPVLHDPVGEWLAGADRSFFM